MVPEIFKDVAVAFGDPEILLMRHLSKMLRIKFLKPFLIYEGSVLSDFTYKVRIKTCFRFAIYSMPHTP